MRVRVKYHHPDLKRLEKKPVGDWIDLRAAADVFIPKGQLKLIPLGVSMEVPEGYEANIVPRSSTASKFGILQGNSYGVVDNSYCGDNDQWFFPAVALRDTEIHFNDRICQFRLNKVMPVIEFEEVEMLGNPDRGGHGSTGVN